MNVDRLCEFCSRTFQPTGRNAGRERFCTKECRVKFFNRGQLGSLVEIACVSCGVMFMPQRSNARACSVACREKAWHRQDYEKNKQKCSQNAKAIAKKRRHETIQAYGGKCVCCGETHEEFLTIDHVYGGGAKERRLYGGCIYARLKRLGFPKDDYRCLCMNCNWSFGKWGYCPHKEKV